METNQPILHNAELDNTSRGYLAETAKWANFLAIFGFVIIGLIVIAGFFAGSVWAFSDSPFFAKESVMLILLYILISAIYFFPCLYLYRFANKARQTLSNNSQADFNESLRNLKACFRFVGIMTLVLLCLYALIFVFALVAGGLGVFN